MAVTFGDGNFTLYHNGTQVAQVSSSLNLSGNTEQLWIGARQDGSWNENHFDGQIDEFAIHDRALTAEELAGLYDSGPVDGGLGSTGDVYDGGADADTFVIGETLGNDTIIGGETVSTGTDYDTVDLSAATAPVSVNYTGPGAGTIADGANTVTFSEVERLTLTAQADVVDASADTVGIDIFAAGGNDTITGGSGNDTFDGGSGNDFAYGEDGDDVFSVEAGTGEDFFDGGTGWTDIIDLGGMDAAVSVSGNTVDGEGWTMVLDAGASINGQIGNRFDLSDDAAGTITFDAGGSVSFVGVESVTW